MKPLIGLALGGACIRPRAGEHDARLGEPAWGPGELLDDLELRLGLPRGRSASRGRVPWWARRLESLRDYEAFYAASFRADPLGTTEVLLEWRDSLIDAGWDGAAIAGARIEALARIGQGLDGTEPLGDAERLVRIERELSGLPASPYEELCFADDARLWPVRWRRVFAALERAGAQLTTFHAETAFAPPDTDLGRLQRVLRGEAIDRNDVRGDGSLLLVRGETPAELSAFFATLLADAPDAAVVRCLDPMPLETALAAHGLPRQGLYGSSAWRPAMQVLPLALELAFEPRDPHRLLELLTLPVGPFQGALGGLLARAVARQPGVLGQEWLRRRAQARGLLAEREATRQRELGVAEEDAVRLAERYVGERIARVEEWLERPGASNDAAPRETLATVVSRVSRWLRKRMGTHDSMEIYADAVSQAVALADAIVDDPRESFSRDDARQLFERVARAPSLHELSVADAGCSPHVENIGASLAPCSTLVVWNFVAAAERPPRRLPWTRQERDELTAHGVEPVDPTALLDQEARSWRRAILGARDRVLFGTPSTLQGVAMSTHSFWDEIRAHLGLDDEARASRVTTDLGRLMKSGDGPVTMHEPLFLPEPHGAWELDEPVLVTAREPGTHATALEELVSCPLRFVLGERARIDAGAVTRVASGALLNGSLSHRLVEELHRESAFDEQEAVLLARADTLLDMLIEREGASLLLEGAAFERVQLRQQIRHGVRALHRFLCESKLRIVAVEEEVSADSPMGLLSGRLDLRLETDEGRPAVLDIKWGASSHRERLEKGRAVQLAVYVRALRRAGEPSPPGAYFSMASGQLLSSDPRLGARPLQGPSLDDTFTRVERTARLAADALARGIIHVAATGRSLPLLEALGVANGDKHRHFDAGRDAPCKTCSYADLCGRSWERLG